MFEYFTPIAGTIGGSMIGLSAVSLLLLNGDILGASGIAASVLLSPRKALSNSHDLWKIAFLTTFLIVSSLIPHFALDVRSSEDTSVPIPSSFAYSLAGLLVGFGTRLGNGCTSGHGVCGMGRNSGRSFVAVLTFMATGIATSILTAPTSSLAEYTSILRTQDRVVEPFNPVVGYALALFMATALLTLPLRVLQQKGAMHDSDKAKVPGAVIAGGLFAGGLAISGMVLPSKLFGFLNGTGIADGTWDPTLATVLGAAVTVSFLSYQFVPKFGVFPNSKKVLNHPLMATTFDVPTNRTIDFNLLFGEAIFGVGWGIGLLCPGPALYHVAVGNPMVLYRWMPLFVMGSAIAQWLKNRQ
jgi:uncharacterized membrane protein YedE/YeeE